MGATRNSLWARALARAASPIAIRRAGAIAVVLPLVTAIGATHAQNLHSVPNTKRPVIDTGLETMAERFLVGPILWLDDYSFTFNPLQDNPDAKLKKAQRGVLYDVRTQRHLTIVENGVIDCAAGDLILFRNRAEQHQSSFARLNVSRTAVDSTGPRTPGATRIDRYSCKPHVRVADPKRLEYFLREGDGYIDRGKVGAGGVEPAVLYRPGTPPLELPLQGKEISIPEFLFFLEKYSIGGWRLLAPDGTISEFPRPRALANAPYRLGPTVLVRNGILSVSGSTERGDRGIFHVTDQVVERLFRGWVELVSVSPNGCRVAFSGGPGFYFTDRNSLKHVNVCDEV